MKPVPVNRDPSVKEIFKRLLFELNHGPIKEKVVRSVEQPKDDVPPPPPPPPPHFSINLCFPNEEEKAEIYRKYKVLHPPAATSDDYFEKLGFLSGYESLMYVSGKKKAKFPGKSLYALGRSWFKEGVTKEDKCVTKDMHKKEKCHRSDDDELKGYLKEFVEQARAAKVLARMSRYAHRCGKKKFVPKMLSLDDLLMALDQEG
ncbi:hypothetical protein HanPI659440_Chr04g0173331 [Helianthus annuus]|nr:hypothetical protein HanPI659440_Chr04g0173331 [Helianthus annuus]